MEEKSIEELRSEIIKLNEEKTKLSEQIDFYKESNGEIVRNYINFDEQYYNIVTESGTISKLPLENAKGVIKTSNYPFNTVLGLNFKVSKKVLDYLYNTLKVKGFFFVR